MKKLNSLGIIKFLLLSFALVFTACENFMNGSAVKDAIEEQIEYYQASPTTVTVSARPETLAQIVPTVGDYPYKKGDPITLRFIASDGYMFKHWEANPSNIIHFDNEKEVSTVAKLTEYADKVNIYPVCVKRPEVISFEPRNSDGVHYKNSHIKIEFDQELSEENDFSQIAITMNGNSVKDSFFDPEWDKASKKIIIRANTKYIDLKSETETINVKIPGSFYFIEDDQKVEIGKDKTFTYTINSSTNEKAEIYFELNDKESGSLTYNQKTDNKYNIGEKISVNYKPAEGWVFFGWNIENGEDVVRIDDDSKFELKTTIEVLSQSVDPVKISPITFKRPEASFSPEKTLSGVPKNSSISITFTKLLSMENDLSKITITMGNESVLEHFENPEWVDNGKEILFQANNDNPIGYTGIDTASIVVKVPADFYYEENGYKISFSEVQSYEYKINSKTNVTTKINFLLDDASSGKLTPSSQSEYYLGDKIQVRFTPDSDWQFTGWKLTGGRGVIELRETGNYTAEVQVLKPSTEVVDISPVVFKRLRLDSVLPENLVNGVPKNRQIELNFTEPLPESDEITDLIKKITVKAGEEDLMEGGCFWTPEVSKTDRRKVIINATKKYIEITSGTRTVTVTVPAELYYETEGNKIYADKNLSFSYRVNPETNEKTYISFVRTDKQSGELDPVGLVPYNLGEYKAVNFVIDADTYRFIKWECSNETAIELITKGIGFGYDDKGFNASTGVATAYFRTRESTSENEPVVITPVVEKIPTMNIYAESKYGRFSQSISGSYKEGTVIPLNFTSDADYQFIKWQIKDKNTKEEINNWTEESGGYIKIADLENSNTTFSLVQAAAADSNLELLIEPLCAKRPKVVSYSPQYTTKGDLRDRTLVVMFSTKMDASSIYYNFNELLELGIVKQTRDVERDYTLLGDFKTSGTFNEGDICYDYYKNSDPDNSIVFKNIRICKLNDQSVNLLKYYGKPVFDNGNTGTLRIPTKITDKSQNIDEAPPKYLEILVTLETGINTKNGEANVRLSEEFSWAYFTNTDTDSKPPVFDDDNIKICIADEESLNFDSVKNKTSLTEFKNPEVSITDTLSNIKTYNPKEGYIWVEMSIADEGSGVDVVNGILTKVNNKYYPNESNKNETLSARIRFTLNGSAQSSTISEKVNLKDYNLTEGLYTLSFEAVDKNAHIALSKYEYQFIYDNEAPKAPKQSDLKEIRKQAETSSLFWTNPQEKDFASVKVVSKNIDNTEELDHEKSFNFNSSSYKTGIQYENLIPNLTPYKHYSHKLIISDYAGNESEVDVPVDYEKPVKIKGFTESRTTTNSATLTWTKPSEADFGKVVIKRVNKTAAEKGETPDDDTIYVLSTASQKKVYTARNFNRYEYTATVVDYSGNESEPETITDIKKPAKASSLAENRSSRTNARVNWTCDADVGKVKIDCYKAEKMPNGSDKETLVSSDEVNTFDKKYIDYTTLINGVRYVYKVTTTDYSGNTNEEIVQCTDNKAPAKVLSVTNRRESSGYETITWTKPDDSDFDHVRIVQYDTYDNSLKFDNVTVEKSYTSKEFSGLKNLHKYKYLVYTVDFAGNENPSYYPFQDNEKPSPVTDVYSGGRNGKIEIYFDVPGNKKMSQVELTGSYNEAISVSSSGANDFKKTFTDLGNGAKKSFTLRVVDYSGNKSDAVSFDETSGAGVGKICHTPSGQDALCSINVYKNKNPVGVVCKADNYESIFIWGIGEVVGKPWGDTDPRACSDEEFKDYYKNEERYSGYEAKVNMASGAMWYDFMMSKKSKWNNKTSWNDSIWNWVYNKNIGSSVKWFIPSVGEYKYIMDNYGSMTNAYKALSDNKYSGTIVETGQPYWVASPRYFNTYANVVEFNSRHIEPDTGKESGKCDWLFYENKSSYLYKMYMTSDERERGYFEKTDTEEDWAYVHTHAMGTISMK